MGARRQASQLVQVGLNVLPVFGHLSPFNSRQKIARLYCKEAGGGTQRRDDPHRASCLRTALKRA